MSKDITEKSCANCKHSTNINNGSIANTLWWDCDNTPFQFKEMFGSEIEFNTFNCSEWVDVFEYEKIIQHKGLH